MIASLDKITAIASLVIKELYRRKDVYVLWILTTVISLLLASVTFFGDDRIIRYLKEICLGLIWLASLVIGISCAARQIPVERESRTLFPLLAKPVTRSEILLGKFFGCWLASGIALLVFYSLFGLLTFSREQTWPVENCIQALGLHWFMLAIVISMTLLGSLASSAVSANVTLVFLITIGILFLGRHLNKIALQQIEPAQTILYVFYYALPHLEFFDTRNIVIHNWPPIAWGACFLAGAYAIFYTAFFLVVACQLFKRTSIN